MRLRNFPVWKARVRARLQASGLLYVLDGEETPAVAVAGGDGSAAGSPSPQERKKGKVGASAAGGASQDSLGMQSQKAAGQAGQDPSKVYGTLILSLDDAHVAIVTSEVAEGDAAGAWRVLLRMYERETTASKHQLRCDRSCVTDVRTLYGQYERRNEV